MHVNTLFRLVSDFLSLLRQGHVDPSIEVEIEKARLHSDASALVYDSRTKISMKSSSRRRHGGVGGILSTKM